MCRVCRYACNSDCSEVCSKSRPLVCVCVCVDLSLTLQNFYRCYCCSVDAFSFRFFFLSSPSEINSIFSRFAYYFMHSFGLWLLCICMALDALIEVHMIFFFKFNSMDFKCIFQNNSYRFLTDKSNRISVASLFNAQRWKKKKKSGMFKHQAAHIFETVLAPNFIIILPSNTIQFTTNCEFYLRNICWY